MNNMKMMNVVDVKCDGNLRAVPQPVLDAFSDVGGAATELERLIGDTLPAVAFKIVAHHCHPARQTALGAERQAATTVHVAADDIRTIVTEF